MKRKALAGLLISLLLAVSLSGCQKKTDTSSMQELQNPNEVAVSPAEKETVIETETIEVKDPAPVSTETVEEVEAEPDQSIDLGTIEIMEEYTAEDSIEGAIPDTARPSESDTPTKGTVSSPEVTDQSQAVESAPTDSTTSGAVNNDGERVYNAQVTFNIDTTYTNGEVRLLWENKGVGPSAAMLTSIDGSYVQRNANFKISDGYVNFSLYGNPVGTYAIMLYTDVPLYGATVECYEKASNFLNGSGTYYPYGQYYPNGTYYPYPQYYPYGEYYSNGQYYPYNQPYYQGGYWQNGVYYPPVQTQ